jgi:hypothetical protein
MKLIYTKQQILDRVKMLDKRVREMTDEQLDLLLDRGYSLLTSQYGSSFSDEEVIDLTPYYEAGELQLTLDIEEDVIDIYDLYLTVEGLDKLAYPQGIRKVRDDRCVYRDNRYNGRVHIDLDVRRGEDYTNAVIKYYYTPNSSTEAIYVDSVTLTALEYAFATAIYSYLKDADSKVAAWNDMIAIGDSIPRPPEDAPEQVAAIF